MSAYDEGGALTEAVRGGPISGAVDEIEKAHPMSSTCCCRCSTRPPDRWPGRTVDFRKPDHHDSNLGRSFWSPAGSEDLRSARAVMAWYVRIPPSSSTVRRDHSVPPPAEERDGPDRRDPVRSPQKLLEERKIRAHVDAGRATAGGQGRDRLYGAFVPLKRVIQASLCRSAGRDDPGRRGGRRRSRRISSEATC